MSKDNGKDKRGGRPNNENARKHGAAGVERRIERNLPLAADDLKFRREITALIGYDPDDLPAGPLGVLVDLIADNVLIAYRFRDARNWTAEQNDMTAWFKVSQRGGWRTDKAIRNLFQLLEVQASADDGLILDALDDAERIADT